MTKTNSNLPSDLSDALAAFTSWLSRDMKLFSPRELREMNAGIVDDLWGRTPRPRIKRKAPIDVDRVRLGYALLYLHAGFFRFATVRMAARLYPWQGRIKRHEHLEMMTHLFHAEVYIYEQRFKTYLDACMHCARVWKVKIDVKPLRDDMLRLYRALFKKFIGARNIHTHEADVSFPHISRLSMIELLSTPNDDFRVSMLGPIALRDAKKQCLADIDSVTRSLTELTAVVIRKTKPVWSLL